jgi:hypothetical protein
MRHKQLPFRFKVLEPEPDRELVFLPQLGAEDVEEVVSRLGRLGYGRPEVVNAQPKVLKFVGPSNSLRFMPRGLLVGPLGTFERLGPQLAIDLHHKRGSGSPLSWGNNDYQHLVPSEKGLVMHVKGRHAPSPRRFDSECARAGTALSADEAMVIIATVEVCSPKTLEIFTSHPGNSTDITRPLPSRGGGFLHHVELSEDTFLADADSLLKECLDGQCPFSPLADSTVVLKGGTIPPSSKGLEDVISVLENWVSDANYFCDPSPLE